jgi:hypothetical protein
VQTNLEVYRQVATALAELIIGGTVSMPLAAGSEPSSEASSEASVRGQIPPTNRQRMIKRPDRRPGDQALTCTYWLGGRDLIPATSGL